MTKQKEHIARISYGKDSLKMLDVIYSRGLPLDRITTTDVWATDTISARLPPMDSFVDRMDQWIWDHYRIEVEHLCAVNKDGTKKTYEQLFYHVPVRRSQIGNVERESRFRPGDIRGWPVIGKPWCQSDLKRSARIPEAGIGYRLSTEYQIQLVPEAQALTGNYHRISSVGATMVPRGTQVQSAETTDFRRRYPPGAESSRSTRSRHLFSGALHEAQRYKCRGISWHRRG